MDKFGDIQPGRTPQRDPSEESIEDLDDCLEKRSAEAAKKRQKMAGDRTDKNG